jgi:hypothetical protein
VGKTEEREASAIPHMVIWYGMGWDDDIASAGEEMKWREKEIKGRSQAGIRISTEGIINQSVQLQSIRERASSFIRAESRGAHCSKGVIN